MEFHSVNKLFQQSFIDHWFCPAISDLQGETYTFEDVCNRIMEYHFFFEQAGIAKGDKIALCGQNQSGWAIGFLATMSYGAVPVPILNDFTPDNIRHLLEHSEARLLLTDAGIWRGLGAQIPANIEAVVNLKSFRLFLAVRPELEAAMEQGKALFKQRYPYGLKRTDVNFYEDSADELAIINYTSGTSGFSKGVMVPYRSVLSNLDFARYFAEPQMGVGQSVVSMLPMAHMYGLMFEFLAWIRSGTHIIYLGKAPSPKIILGAFAQVKPDLIITVPLVIEKIYKGKIKDTVKKLKFLLNVPAVNSLIRDSIRKKLEESFGGKFEEIIMGGAAFNPEAEKFFHDLKFRYTVGYGMTECAPIIAYAHWDKAKLYSCGQAAPNMEIRIISPDPENIPGDVQVRGDNVFLGYYKNPEATAESFTEDGWFKTGDIGVMDKDGFLFLKGRSKCMILGPSGQNIYPEEIEYSINNLPLVNDSLVIDDEGSLVALIYPDFAAGEAAGLDAAATKAKIEEQLPALNKSLPVYSKIKKMEFRDEDFERTPKKSIRRFLYQRNAAAPVPEEK
ncbi:MAG: AMP-binding protein [Bacteroidales bacterium]|nr:AMP-binding protein [Bacteroidales bacterium]